MKKFDLYDKVEARRSRQQLPVGGYKCKILDGEILKYSWGEVLLVSFDIEEGEYKNFFKNDYKNNSSDDKKWRGTIRYNLPNGGEYDEDNAKTFKGLIECIEHANSGYKWEWDEKTIKDKTVGLMFGEEEWEYKGKTGMTVKARYALDLDGLKTAKIPSPKMLKKTSSGFTSSNQEDDDLPF